MPIFVSEPLSKAYKLEHSQLIDRQSRSIKLPGCRTTRLPVYCGSTFSSVSTSLQAPLEIRVPRSNLEISSLTANAQLVIPAHHFSPRVPSNRCEALAKKIYLHNQLPNR